MSRDIAVVVPDIEIIWVFSQRSGHCHCLLAPVATAEPRWARIPNLHTEVELPGAMILIA